MVARLEFCLGQLLPPLPGGLWTASRHREGIQRLLVLLAGVPVYSAVGYAPLLNFWEHLHCTGPRQPHTGVKKTLGLIYNQQVHVLQTSSFLNTPTSIT